MEDSALATSSLVASLRELKLIYLVTVDTTQHALLALLPVAQMENGLQLAQLAQVRKRYHILWMEPQHWTGSSTDVRESPVDCWGHSDNEAVAIPV